AALTVGGRLARDAPGWATVPGLCVRLRSERGDSLLSDLDRQHGGEAFDVRTLKLITTIPKAGSRAHGLDGVWATDAERKVVRDHLPAAVRLADGEKEDKLRLYAYLQLMGTALDIDNVDTARALSVKIDKLRELTKEKGYPFSGFVAVDWARHGDMV